jgi:hypothetical protein
MPLGFNVYPEMQLLLIRGEGVITQPERVDREKCVEVALRPDTLPEPR